MSLKAVLIFTVLTRLFDTKKNVAFSSVLSCSIVTHRTYQSYTGMSAFIDCTKKKKKERKIRDKKFSVFKRSYLYNLQELWRLKCPTKAFSEWLFKHS